MSHYTKNTMTVTNQEALVSALVDMGFDISQIQTHEEAVNLEGYRGDTREQKANIVIKRQHVGGAANDIGFERVQDGTFQAHISEFDSGNSAAKKKNSKFNKKVNGYDAEWLRALSQRYARHVQAQVAAAHNWQITNEEITESGDVVLHLYR